jgi:hypothetical protein
MPPLNFSTHGDIHPSLLFNIVLEIPSSSTRQEKETEDIQKRKEHVKSFLFPHDLTAYIEIPRNIQNLNTNR